MKPKTKKNLAIWSLTIDIILMFLFKILSFYFEKISESHLSNVFDLMLIPIYVFLFILIAWNCKNLSELKLTETLSKSDKRKIKRWSILIDGNCNELVFIQNSWMQKYLLIVNGKEILMKKQLFQYFRPVDRAINIAGKECRFVLIKNKADIVVDGVYVNSNKKYVPLKKVID